MNPLHGVVVLALVEDQPDQVYEGEEDQGGRQDGLADVEEAPGDLTVAGPPVLADLNISHVGKSQLTRLISIEVIIAYILSDSLIKLKCYQVFIKLKVHVRGIKSNIP